MSSAASIESLRAKHESAEALRDMARYTFAEVARYLDMPDSTVRAWTVGCSYTDGFFEPLIEPSSYEPPNRLSFNNLIELFVLRALRQEHLVRMRRIRDAIDYTQKEYGIDRLLLSKELRAAPGRVLLERFGELDEVSSPGQGIMAELLEAHLERLEWDQAGFAEKLYPPTREEIENSPKIIAIVPSVSFGRPIIDGSGVKASVIARRFEAGESIRLLCSDFGLKPSQVEEALRWERRAA